MRRFKNHVRISGAFDHVAGKVPLGRALLRIARKTRVDFQTMLLAIGSRHPEPPQVPSLHIETTNICNANCIFCGYQFQGAYRTQETMSEWLYQDVLRQYRDLGGTWVDLTPMVGEPLVDPRLAERLHDAREFGMQTAFTTNGILLRNTDVSRLLDARPVVIAISTTPFRRELYEKIYRSLNYDAVLEGLEKLLGERNRIASPTIVSLKFRGPISLRDALRMKDFQVRVRPLLSERDLASAECIKSAFDTWGGQISQRDLLPGMLLALPPSLKIRPCRNLSTIMVTSSGLVRACACRFRAEGNPASAGLDGLVIGDVKDQPLAEIIRGPRMRQLWATFGQRKLPGVCKDCTLYRPL
jgi:MoaA/NifB/PqqE/SkfB family radical SAM enzyme